VMSRKASMSSVLLVSPSFFELQRQFELNIFRWIILDQTVKLLCDTWHLQDIPNAFLTSFHATVTGARGGKLLTPLITKHSINQLRSRYTQLLSPISPSTQPSPISPPAGSQRTARLIVYICKILDFCFGSLAHTYLLDSFYISLCLHIALDTEPTYCVSTATLSNMPSASIHYHTRRRRSLEHQLSVLSILHLPRGRTIPRLTMLCNLHRIVQNTIRIF
jgi:hypothetical protein